MLLITAVLSCKELPCFGGDVNVPHVGATLPVCSDGTHCPYYVAFVPGLYVVATYLHTHSAFASSLQVAL